MFEFDELEAAEPAMFRALALVVGCLLIVFLGDFYSLALQVATLRLRFEVYSLRFGLLFWVIGSFWGRHSERPFWFFPSFFKTSFALWP